MKSTTLQDLPTIQKLGLIVVTALFIFSIFIASVAFFNLN